MVIYSNIGHIFNFLNKFQEIASVPAPHLDHVFTGCERIGRAGLGFYGCQQAAAPPPTGHSSALLLDHAESELRALL